MADVDNFRIAYANRIPMATITSSSEMSGYPDDNVADQNRQTYYRPDGTPPQTEWIKIDMGAAYAVNFLGHLNHNFKTWGVTNVQLKCGSTDNGSTWDIIPVTWNPSAEATVFDKFHVFTQSPAKRYWLYVVDTVAAKPQLGEIFLGNCVDVNFSWPDARIIDQGVAIDESAGGYDTAEQYGTTRQIIELNGASLTDTQRELLVTIDVFQKNGLNPICLVDVGEDEAEGKCIYGRLLGPLAHSRVFIDAGEVRHTFRQVL